MAKIISSNFRYEFQAKAFEKYRQCGALRTQLARLLATDDAEELKADIAKEGWHHWSLWEAENREAIDSFLLASPAKRQSMYPDRKIQRRLALAALLRTCQAEIFLYSVSQTEPYKKHQSVCADAGLRCSSIVEKSIGIYQTLFDPKFPFGKWIALLFELPLVL